MGAMRARALIGSGLACNYLPDLHPARARAMAESSTGDWEALVKCDPGNTIAWNTLFVSRNWRSRALFAQGDGEGAVAVWKGSVEAGKRAPLSWHVLGKIGTLTVSRAAAPADLRGRRPAAFRMEAFGYSLRAVSHRPAALFRA